MQQHDSEADAEILETEDILSPEGKNQQHFGCPDTDAFELHKLIDDLLIRFFWQGFEIECAIESGFGNALEIFDFACGQSACVQIVKGTLEQILGCDGHKPFFDSCKFGTGGFEGELLPDDALNQGKKQVVRALEGLHIALLNQHRKFWRLPA